MPLGDKIKQLGKRLLIDTAQTNDETAGSQRFRQTVSEAQANPESATKIYANAAKDRATETAAAFAIPLSGGVAGPIVADATNLVFAADGLYNLASGNGIQKTYRLARQGDGAGAARSAGGDALNIAMTVPAVRLLSGVEKGLAVGNSLKGAYTLDLIGRELNNGIRTTPIIINPVQQNILAGKLGGAPRQTKVLGHNSDAPITKLKTNFPAWDVVERNAPLGHVGMTGTETKQGFIGARPFHNRSTEEVILNKPMVQLNESIGNGKNTVRNEILRFADQSGADAINFNNIKDNTLSNQDVYAVFKDIDVAPKLTQAEMLGIPKSLRSNPKALEDHQYWGYQQWNQRYNAAVESGNLEEAQRLRNLHFNSHAKNNVIVDDLGMPKKVYHGSPEEFNVFDYTKSAKYPDGHFFFGEDFDYVKSHVKRRTSESPNIKSYYLYDTEKYPINKNKIDKRIVPHIIDKNGFPLKNELSSDMASYIMTHFQDKPHIIYGYDVGREVMSGKYDYAVPFNTQIKLTNPITYDNGKIIPIVKRDNFHNPDIRYKQGGILKAQGGNIITLSPLDQAKRQAYKIVTDPNVGGKGGANLKDVVKNIFRSKPVMEDQNKAEFLFGVKRPETTDGQAYNWENDIKENGYKNVKSYKGTLNPYNEYVLNDRDKELVKELAKSGYTTSLNVNDEYSDPKTGFIDPDTPYFDDVHGYRVRFHNDENGNPVISASDLYDFGKNYSKDFKDLNIERGGNGNLELQRRALNLVGQPYKLVQHNIPIRFTDNPHGSEIYRTNSFTHQVLDKLSDKDIAKITNSGLINPAIIRNKQGGILKHQPGGILSLGKKAYDSKLGNGIRTVLFGKDYNLSDEEYLEKHGFTKPLTGMAPLPTIPESGPFQGIENLAQGNFGTGAVYNAGLQNKLTKIASDRVLKNYSSSVSKGDKFLQRSLREQDDIVKFWNGERFKSMKQLEQYPKELNKFKNGILKHQQGGIFDVAYNPYLKQEQQQPTEFIPEIPEPYVPSYTFDKPQEEQIVIAPLPEVQETKEPETVEKDPDAVGHFRNFGDSIDFYEGGIYTKAYRDAHGGSIGKGHFLGTEDKGKNYTITKEQAQKMLEQDYKRIKDALDKQIAKHPEKSKIIDDVRYNVLFDLGFNIGTGYYDKIFNDGDGTKEGMASILNKYGRRSLATDPNRKAQEEKALAKRVDARIRAWNA